MSITWRYMLCCPLLAFWFMYKEPIGLYSILFSYPARTSSQLKLHLLWCWSHLFLFLSLCLISGYKIFHNGLGTGARVASTTILGSTIESRSMLIHTGRNYGFNVLGRGRLGVKPLDLKGAKYGNQVMRLHRSKCEMIMTYNGDDVNDIRERCNHPYMRHHWHTIWSKKPDKKTRYLTQLWEDKSGGMSLTLDLKVVNLWRL